MLFRFWYDSPDFCQTNKGTVYTFRSCVVENMFGKMESLESCVVENMFGKFGKSPGRKLSQFAESYGQVQTVEKIREIL